MHPVLQKYIDRQSRLMTIQWTSHFLTYGIYYYIVQNHTGAVKGPVVYPHIIFPVLSVLFVITGVLISRAAFSSDKIYKRFLRPVTLPAELAGLSDTEKEIYRILTDSYVYYVISIGLVHTCAIFGLVSSMNSGDSRIYLIHAAVSVAGALFCRPRVRQLLEALQLSGM